MSGRWDADTRTWVGWEHLGPEPGAWGGPLGTLAPEPGLHAYQRRNIPLVDVGAVRIAGGPRPPYFGWHSAEEALGQPSYRMSLAPCPAPGIHLDQRHETARRRVQSEGEVLAFYTATTKLVVFDGRPARRYTARETEALLGRAVGAATGAELTSVWREISARVRELGFNALVTGDSTRSEAIWGVFDPRCFKRFVRASAWSRDEVTRREGFDPTPMVLAHGGFEDGLPFGA